MIVYFLVMNSKRCTQTEVNGYKYVLNMLLQETCTTEQALSVTSKIYNGYSIKN